MLGIRGRFYSVLLCLLNATEDMPMPFDGFSGELFPVRVMVTEFNYAAFQWNCPPTDHRGDQVIPSSLVRFSKHSIQANPKADTSASGSSAPTISASKSAFLRETFTPRFVL